MKIKFAALLLIGLFVAQTEAKHHHGRHHNKLRVHA